MVDSFGSSYGSLGSTSSKLLERARSRDQDAWRRLVNLYGCLVLYWCGQAGLQQADRSEVFQEVFRAVAKNIERFRSDRRGDTFRGWLRTITRRKIVDYCRQRSRQFLATGRSEAYQRLLSLHDVPVESQGESDSPEESSLLVSRAMRLVRSEFEDRTWLAFLRTASDGLPSSLVAEELGMTPEAVRKAKSRVLRRIREELQEVPD